MDARKAARWTIGACLCLGVSSGALGDDSAARRALRTAHGLLNRGMDDAAISEYRAALQGGLGESERDEALYGLSVCLVHAQEWNEALRALEAISSRPDFEFRNDSLMLRGRCLMMMGDYSGASESLKTVAADRSSPLAGAAWGARIECLYRAGALDEAITLWDRGEDPWRGPAPAYFAARALHERGRNDDAIAVLTRASNAMTDDFGVHADLLLGRCYDTQGREAEAAAVYERVAHRADEIGDDALRIEAQCSLARCELEIGEAKQSAARLRTIVLELKEAADGGLLYDLGVAEWRSGDLKHAEAAFAESLAKGEGPWRADAAFAMIGVALDRERFQEVIDLSDAFVKEFAADQRVGQSVVMKGAAAEHLGDADAARRAYARAAECPDETARRRATLRLGLLLHREGDFEAAQTTLRPFADENLADSAPALLALGDMAIARNEHATATTFLERYLALDAESQDRGDAMLMLGRAAAIRGEHARALEWFERAAEYRGGVAEHAMLGAASSLEALGRGEEAHRAIQRASSSNEPGVSAAALHRLASEARHRGDFAEEARLWLKVAALAQGAGSGDALMRAAQAHAEAGDTRAAEALFAQLATDQDPSRAGEALARRGLLRIAHGAPAPGRRDLDAAIATLEAGPLHDAVQIERARALHESGAHDDAITVLHDVVKASTNPPTRARAWYETAVIARNTGQTDTAADALRNARESLDQAPADAAHGSLIDAVWTFSASLALEQSRDADALALTEELRSIRGESAIDDGVLLTRGEALRRLGKHREAALALQRPADSRDAEIARVALLSLGDALASAQRWAESQACYERFLDRFAADEQWFRAEFGAAWALENQGDRAGAITRYRRVADEHTGDTAARAQFQIGECLYAMKQFDDAVTELLKVDILHSNPEWSAAALYEAARCLRDKGDEQGARARFAEVIERFNDSQWSAMAKQQLSSVDESGGDA